MGASASASALNEQGAKALDELSGAGPLDASNPAWNVLLGSQHKLHVADAGAIQESIAKAAKDLSEASMGLRSGRQPPAARGGALRERSATEAAAGLLPRVSLASPAAAAPRQGQALAANDA